MSDSGLKAALDWPSFLQESWDDLFADAGGQPATVSVRSPAPPAHSASMGGQSGSIPHDPTTHIVNVDSTTAGVSGGSTLNADLDRWFAEADADGDGRQDSISLIQHAPHTCKFEAHIEGHFEPGHA